MVRCPRGTRAGDRGLLLPLTVLGFLMLVAGLAGCGGSGTAVSLVRATDGLARFIGSGRVLVDCPGNIEPTCTPQSDLPVILSPADQGQRLAVLYGDGHAAVWDLGSDKTLLETPAQPPPGLAGLAGGLWLSGAGNALALNVGAATSPTVMTQIWSVSRRRLVQELGLRSAWLYTDASMDKSIVIPNPVSGSGFVYLNLRQRKLLARPKVPFVSITEHSIPDNIIAPTAVGLDTKANTFVMASDAIRGFLTWSARSGVKETEGHCADSGVLSSNNEEFACFSLVGRATFMTIWNVASHRKLDEWWMPGISPAIPPGSPVFLNNDQEIAVPASRSRGDDQIEVFSVRSHHVVDTVQLRPAPSVFSTVTLTGVGHDLVVEENTGGNSSLGTVNEWFQVFTTS